MSEILRVARAPEEIYSRYSTGFFGFKAALKSCRMYNVTPSEELTRRKIKRAAERLILLVNGAGEVRVNGRRIVIE